MILIIVILFSTPGNEKLGTSINKMTKILKLEAHFHNFQKFLVNFLKSVKERFELLGEFELTVPQAFKKQQVNKQTFFHFLFRPVF